MHAHFVPFLTAAALGFSGTILSSDPALANSGAFLLFIYWCWGAYGWGRLASLLIPCPKGLCVWVVQLAIGSLLNTLFATFFSASSWPFHGWIILGVAAGSLIQQKNSVTFKKWPLIWAVALVLLPTIESIQQAQLWMTLFWKLGLSLSAMVLTIHLFGRKEDDKNALTLGLFSGLSAYSIPHTSMSTFWIVAGSLPLFSLKDQWRVLYGALWLSCSIIPFFKNETAIYWIGPSLILTSCLSIGALGLWIERHFKKRTASLLFSLLGILFIIVYMAAHHAV